jgi:hypothetical protein
MQLGLTPGRTFGLLTVAALLVTNVASADYTQDWAAELVRGTAAGLAVGPDGRSFATVQQNSGSSLYALDDKGKVLWRVKSKENFGWVAVSADGASAIVAGNTKSGKILVTSYAADTGKAEWKTTYVAAKGFKTRTGALVTVSAKDGAIYVAATVTKSGVCCAYVIGKLTVDGELVWNHRTGNAAGDEAFVSSIVAEPRGKGVFVAGSGTDEGIATPLVAHYDASGAEKFRTYRDPTSQSASITVSSNGKKLFVLGRKLDAPFYQVALFTNKGKEKWLRPLLLNGIPASSGTIALTDNDKSLLIAASMLGAGVDERGFLMKVDTKTSGPNTMISGGDGFPLGIWYRFAAPSPTATAIVAVNQFDQVSLTALEPMVVSYTE